MAAIGKLPCLAELFRIIWQGDEEAAQPSHALRVTLGPVGAVGFVFFGEIAHMVVSRFVYAGRCATPYRFFPAKEV
jgi:hypothetical protein